MSEQSSVSHKHTSTDQVLRDVKLEANRCKGCPDVGRRRGLEQVDEQVVDEVRGRVEVIEGQTVLSGPLEHPE
jgi:hypothetical protein